MKLSAVINTRNEERNIVACLKSVAPHVDEIVIVDMQSTDETVKRARAYTKKIFTHSFVGYVEPARNFAIQKATGDWILVLDADEFLPETLGLKLRKLAETDFSFYRVPRKNIIFGRFMQHSGWWPDYQIRFFQKNAVSWANEIHSIPITQGRGTDLEASPELALLHHHYTSIEQYLERLNIYTTQEAKQLAEENIHFERRNLIIKPMNEFLSRFFAREGYKDGMHGLALSLLQAFSFLIVQLKLWQYAKFAEKSASENILDETVSQLKQAHSDLMYWYYTTKNKQDEGVAKVVNKLRAKIRL